MSNSSSLSGILYECWIADTSGISTLLLNTLAVPVKQFPETITHARSFDCSCISLYLLVHVERTRQKQG
jgi:hypothetical protein